MRNSILIADDEPTLLETLGEVLRQREFHVVTAANGRQAVQRLAESPIDVALLDIRMPALDGLQVLARARQAAPDTQVIMITAFGTVEDAVEALKLGASDYVTKPVIFDDLLIKIDRLLGMRRLAAQNQSLMNELEGRDVPEGIVGRSRALRDILQVVARLSRTRTSGLIEGESGTGKELIARAIHYGGITRQGRFVGINCAALPESLAESELFGHKRGAFTGASRDKPGLFELATGGTIFLDEISAMPPAIQAKLLRAIEERCILPVGGSETIEIDARILCATNHNLAREVEAGRFREDLYYRLNVVEIWIPPLRQRREDIPPLVDHFIARYNKELGRHCPGVSDQALQALVAYGWPGNVRELKNVLERAVLFADDCQIGPEDLALRVNPSGVASENPGDLKSALEACERQHVMEALCRNRFDKNAAARDLHIGLSSLYRKIEEFGITRNECVPGPATGSAPEQARGTQEKRPGHNPPGDHRAARVADGVAPPSLGRPEEEGPQPVFQMLAHEPQGDRATDRGHAPREDSGKRVT
jgi:two-component system response regulator PilR (NtrC family)